MNRFKSGFVAIVGRPNVGKSSLVNVLVGDKVAIVSERPQTTRNRIMGVVNGDGYQIVLVDTPGMQKARNKLGQYMEGAVSSALEDVDIKLVVLDASTGIGAKDEDAIARAAGGAGRVIALLNKMDIADAQKAEELAVRLAQDDRIAHVCKVSAATGQGLKELLDLLIDSMPEGPMYFPEDTISDMPEAFMCAEFIREKALQNLREEIPHGIGVELERFFEREDGIVEVHAVIYCEKKSHKGIIIGKNGSMLKKIGTQAREDMERFFNTKVFVQLFVKVREDWRDSNAILKDLGYED